MIFDIQMEPIQISTEFRKYRVPYIILGGDFPLDVKYHLK